VTTFAPLPFASCLALSTILPRFVTANPGLLVGSFIEFNVVRDAPVAYSADGRAQTTLFRRNHGYYWNIGPQPDVIGIQLRQGAANMLLEANVFEGPDGGEDEWIKRLVREGE